MNKFIFTCGDINGIGPELVIKALNKIAIRTKDKFIFICPQNVFDHTSKIVKPKFDFAVTNSNELKFDSTVTILNYGSFKQKIGSPTKDSGRASFLAIKKSFELTINKIGDAIITSPISKNAINMAGEKFPGHTEMYAEWCGVKNFVMMFLSKKMNAALATIHEPLKNVPHIITKNSITQKLEVIIAALKNDLRISLPRIAILGLNPHAGENGLIGLEEKEIIIPVISESKLSKYLSGPFSPDAFFANQMYKKFNLVLGMYHDQVLIPFKMINFGEGVNYTAGLPIVRTSPDHGTAFDIAGRGIANESSLIKSFLYAKKIVSNRTHK